jgi:hypothetical protein
MGEATSLNTDTGRLWLSLQSLPVKAAGHG